MKMNRLLGIKQIIKFKLLYKFKATTAVVLNRCSDKILKSLKKNFI